jgi:WD40 repeat protein
MTAAEHHHSHFPGTERAILTSHTAAPYSVALSRDGKVLASARWHATIKLWDPSTGK